MKFFPAIIAILFFAVGVTAQVTNGLSDAEIQGQQLAKKILEQKPAENFTNIATFHIRNSKGNHLDYPILFKVFVTSSNWQSVYAFPLKISDAKTNYQDFLKIEHADAKPNVYQALDPYSKLSDTNFFTVWTNNLIMAQLFGGSDCESDFWIADLGLEFFHWPEQKILKKELKRSRGCSVLESTNPDPSTNGYSRVVSWIDNDGGGIVQAFAYDAQGKLLKEFYPTSLKKVNGQYQVQEMEMINDQTKSRTRLTFDLKN